MRHLQKPTITTDIDIDNDIDIDIDIILFPKVNNILGVSASRRGSWGISRWDWARG